MSRLIRSSIFPSDSSYLEFRFEHSLRKYEQKPIKKVKCNEICSHCIIHHIKKQPMSPAQPPTFRNRISYNQNTAQRRVKLEQSEDKHLISSNKSIRLSKPRQLEERSANANNLEMKIYASLANISMDKGSKEASKQASSERRSEIEDEVYLNDFELSEAMEEEKEEEEEMQFNKIQIGEKSQIGMKEEQDNGNEVKELRQQSVEASSSEEKCLSAGFERLSVADLPELSSRRQLQAELQKGEQQIPQAEPKHNIQIKPEQQQQQQEPASRGNIRKRPCSDSAYSNILEESAFSQQLMDKCLAFQGGRIYIDSQGQNFYISVRVFNKLRRQSSSLDDLLTTLIHQRPYLSSSRDQLRTQLQSYLHSS